MRAPPRSVFCIDDARFDAHEAPPGHPERPARLAAVRRGLIAPLLAVGATKRTPRAATREELARVHTASYLGELAYALAEPEGYLDADTFFSPGTRSAAWLAAGGAAELGRALALSSEAAAWVLAARPPGHHATADRAMGFCLINNVAVAASSALAHGAERVAIVDWDVHHGNGTQAIFEGDPRVLFISLHQWPQYPGTGRSEEVGKRAALGQTVNLPLPSGSGSDDYAAAFRDVVVPRLIAFEPSLVLVSCGFDAHADDPLGGMLLADADYGAMTGALWDSMGAFGCDRLGLVLEGGYDLGALERAGRSVADALLGTAAPLAEGLPSSGARLAIDATLCAHESIRSLP